jgi:phosphoglucosamine mutase
VEPAQARNIGRAKRIDDGRFRYVERAKASFPPDRSLAGLRVVIDCANGAAYRTAPQVLWELGAELIEIGVAPDGLNINAGCGSTNVEAAARAVVQYRADIGLCLDGDADRLMVLDETGRVADGDQIMALLAGRWAEAGRLRDGTLVATVMSNLGLERYLAGRGLRLERTPVGDRYVVERMRAGGWNLGGEQSGHIVMTDYATTGDGLIAALQFLAAMVETGRRASDLSAVFETVPQMLRNVRHDPAAAPLEQAAVQAAIAAGEARMGTQGRLLIRKSGTEPMIRIMGECEDEALLGTVLGEVVAAVEGVA